MSISGPVPFRPGTRAAWPRHGRNRLWTRAAVLSPTRMPDHTAADRIDAALARIEAAVDARARAADALARRHAALKARMAEAVTALDDVIARGAAG